MTLYFLIKFRHVRGAIVILGTGTGIAFFMLMAHRSGDAAFIARTDSTVVIADMLFTPAIVLSADATVDAGQQIAFSSEVGIGSREENASK